MDSLGMDVSGRTAEMKESIKENIRNSDEYQQAIASGDKAKIAEMNAKMKEVDQMKMNGDLVAKASEARSANTDRKYKTAVNDNEQIYASMKADNAKEAAELTKNAQAGVKKLTSSFNSLGAAAEKNAKPVEKNVANLGVTSSVFSGAQEALAMQPKAAMATPAAGASPVPINNSVTNAPVAAQKPEESKEKKEKADDSSTHLININKFTEMTASATEKSVQILERIANTLAGQKSEKQQAPRTERPLGKPTSPSLGSVAG